MVMPERPVFIEPDPYSAALASSSGWLPAVSSSYGDRLLGDVPVDGGSVTWSSVADIQGQCAFTVPRLVDGFDWCPKRDPYHPLADYGQEVVVAVQTVAVDGGTFDETLGTFQIQSWDADDSTVQVRGACVLKPVAENRFVVPQSPRSGGTFRSEATRLLGGMAPVRFSSLLVDRRVPSSMSWGDERLEALYDIAKAWPARLRVDPFNGVEFLAPLPEVGVPAYTLRDGPGGTVLARGWSSTREGRVNRLIARGTESDEAGRPSVWAGANVRTGPLDPFGPNGVQTGYFSSPLLTSKNVAQKSSQTRLENLNRYTSTVPVTVVADPRVRLDDYVEALVDGERTWGYVTGCETPLVIQSESDTMRVDLAVTA